MLATVIAAGKHLPPRNNSVNEVIVIEQDGLGFNVANPSMVGTYPQVGLSVIGLPKRRPFSKKFPATETLLLATPDFEG